MDDKLGIATEKYNEVNSNLTKTKNEITQNEIYLSKSERDLANYRVALNNRVEEIYKYGEIGLLDVIFDAESFQDLITQMDLIERITLSDAEMIEAITTKRADIEKNKEALKEKKKRQEELMKKIGEERLLIANQLSSRNALYNRIKGDISALEAAESARRAMAAEQARSSTNSVSRGGNKAVVDIATRYLGIPYQWGADGLDSFDCSGFTMHVYSKVGVKLPHSSRSQYSSGKRISRDQLAPGDLVFFGRPIHHVGIYIGAGNFIHAPRTGDVISIDSLSSRSNYVGACRP
ncbi:MAG: NlpC/P60 family protein [Actinomycetota bacterium]|nr:NlpC/P60 family protein [Actinomycetota bacterium]